MIARLAILGAALLAAPAFAKEYDIPASVEPPQVVKAITLQASDGRHSVEIRNGKVLVPADVPLPWTVASPRFEPTTYTQTDLEQHRPLAIREFGQVRGVLRCPNPRNDDHFVLLLRRVGNASADELPLALGGDGGFMIHTAAGQYEGAALGATGATRIRSGIVVAPGKTTDLGALLCESTVQVSLRVVDAKRGTPVPQAKIEWDPPEIFNASAARVLYAGRWSATTNQRGVATLPSVGPLPIALRWHVRASGYALARSRSIEVRDAKPVLVPDIALQAEAVILVRVTLPRELGELWNASLVLGAADEQNGGTYRPTQTRAALHEGEIKLPADTYGRKRLWVEAASGKKLLYHDFEVASEKTIVPLAPALVDISGSATQKGAPLEGVTIRLADPRDARTVLGVAKTNPGGGYQLRTYQSGHASLYAVQRGGAGLASGSVSRDVDLGGALTYGVDFDFSGSGASIRVVDAMNDTPLRATVDERLEFKKGGGSQGIGETDGDGHLTFESYPDGVAHLQVGAKGYRIKELDVPLNADAGETVVKLDKSGTVAGRVVEVNGAPIAHARISGGYSSELMPQGRFEAMTDEDGRFHFDSAPEVGTTFYVAAARHALGITTLQPGQENTIPLQSPGRGSVVLLPDNAPPKRMYMVMAAPAGGDYVPLGALQDLGEVNGLSAFQLLGTARDGTIVLPQFLPGGSYSLYVTLKRSGSMVYDKVGTVSVPSEKSIVLSYKER
jgi:protocatechuate 3,4-dioxygenase beta subunit